MAAAALNDQRLGESEPKNVGQVVAEWLQQEPDAQQRQQKASMTDQTPGLMRVDTSTARV